MKVSFIEIKDYLSIKFTLVLIEQISIKKQKSSNDQTSNKVSNDQTVETTDLDQSTSSQLALTKAQTETSDKVLKCMNVLIDIASQTNRNIILDQVYFSNVLTTHKTRLSTKDLNRCQIDEFCLR